MRGADFATPLPFYIKIFGMGVVRCNLFLIPIKYFTDSLMQHLNQHQLALGTSPAPLLLADHFNFYLRFKVFSSRIRQSSLMARK